MPLFSDSNDSVRSDGKYIHFKLIDGDRAFVQCAVDVDFIFQRGLKDGIREQNSRALFRLYQKEIEAIASAKFDAGSVRPLITATDSGLKGETASL